MILRNRVNASAKMNACSAWGMREKCHLAPKGVWRIVVEDRGGEEPDWISEAYNFCVWPLQHRFISFLSVVFSCHFKGDLGYECMKGWSWFLVSFYLHLQPSNLTPPPLPLPTRNMHFPGHGILENSVVFLREGILSGFFFWGEGNRGNRNRTWFLSFSKPAAYLFEK